MNFFTRLALFSLTVLRLMLPPQRRSKRSPRQVPPQSKAHPPFDPCRCHQGMIAVMDVDKSLDGEGKDVKDAKDAHPRAKKYKMTEAMKGLIWNLVYLSNECYRIENEKK